MSFRNYVPTVFHEEINRELEKVLVYAEDTNTEYEGEVKKAGDVVRILNIARPTVSLMKKEKFKLPDPERVEDASTSMPINRLAAFNYYIGDIDKKIALGNIKDSLAKEQSYATAAVIDQYLADLSLDKICKRTAETTVTKDNILDLIDRQAEELYKNDVPVNEPLTLYVSPTFKRILKLAYVHLDTDNSEMLENGKVGKYSNIIVKMTNNYAKEGKNQLLQLKTKKAVAFAKPYMNSMPYVPENGLDDAVKGYTLFDAKITRPKEIISLVCNYA